MSKLIAAIAGLVLAAAMGAVLRATTLGGAGAALRVLGYEAAFTVELHGPGWSQPGVGPTPSLGACAAVPDTVLVDPALHEEVP